MGGRSQGRPPFDIYERFLKNGMGPLYFWPCRVRMRDNQPLYPARNKEVLV